MQVPVNFYKITNVFFVTFQLTNACRLVCIDHLWLTFLEPNQYDIVLFEIITLHIYNIIVTKGQHGIGHNYIIALNESLEFISTSIIELVNIGESSHEEAIVIFITNKDLSMTEKNYAIEDDDCNCFELSYS